MGVIAAGTKDGRVRLVDCRTGEGRWSPFQGAMWGGDDENSRCIWNRTGLQVHSKAVLCVAISREGTFVVSGSQDRSWRICDVKSGHERLCVRGHDHDKDAELPCLCGARNRAEECPVVGHAGAVVSVAISPCGQRVATGSTDRTARIWLARTGEPARAEEAPDATLSGGGPSPRGDAPELRLEGHEGSVTSLAFISGGEAGDKLCLWSGSKDGTMRLWDGCGRQLLAIDELRWRETLCVTLSPDHRWLAAAGAITSNQGGEGPWVAAGAAGVGSVPVDAAQLWDAHTGERARAMAVQLPAERRGTMRVWALAFSPDASALAACIALSSCLSLRVLDLESGAERARIEARQRVATSQIPASMAFSVCGTLLAINNADGEGSVWSVASGLRVLTLPADAEVCCVTAARDWTRDAKCVAFAMGQHERLGGGAAGGGARSPVRALDTGVMRLILDNV